MIKTNLLKPNHLKNTKKYIFLYLMIMVCSVACEKAKDIVAQQSEDIVINIMTNGRWVLDQFSASGVDVKAEFNGYEFQFLKDGTVDAINGTEVTKGTWKASQANMTITSAFPSGNNTLKRLNYVWYISKSGLTYVEAKVVDNGYTSNMRLIKK